jgi:hypothetical protein
MTDQSPTDNVVQFPGTHKGEVVQFPFSHGELSSVHELRLYRDLSDVLMEHVDNRCMVSAIGAIGVLHMLANALHMAYVRSTQKEETDE